MERKIIAVLLAGALGVLIGFFVWFRPMPFVAFLVLQAIGAADILTGFILLIRYCLGRNRQGYAITITVVATILTLFYLVYWFFFWPESLSLIYALTAFGGVAVFGGFITGIVKLIAYHE